jgi:hypothetical protein
MSNHDCLESMRFEVDFILRGIASRKDAVFDTDTVCAICQLPLTEDCPKEFGCCGGTPRQFSCGHVFHIGCFISMLISAKKMICPLCKTDFFLKHILKK